MRHSKVKPVKVNAPPARVAVAPRAFGPAAPAPAQPPAERGYGDSFFAAGDVAASARRMAELLGGPSLRDSLGASNQWAVVDEVAGEASGKPREKQARPAAQRPT